MPTATTSEVDATATSDVCALTPDGMCTQGIPVADAPAPDGLWRPRTLALNLSYSFHSLLFCVCYHFVHHIESTLWDIFIPLFLPKLHELVRHPNQIYSKLHREGVNVKSNFKELLYILPY